MNFYWLFIHPLFVSPFWVFRFTMFLRSLSHPIIKPLYSRVYLSYLFLVNFIFIIFLLLFSDSPNPSNSSRIIIFIIFSFLTTSSVFSWPFFTKKLFAVSSSGRFVEIFAFPIFFIILSRDFNNQCQNCF